MKNSKNFKIFKKKKKIENSQNFENFEKKNFYLQKINNIIYTIHKNCKNNENFKIIDYKKKIKKNLNSKKFQIQIFGFLNIFFQNNKNCNDKCFHFINFDRTLKFFIKQKLERNFKSDLKILNFM